MSLLSSAMPGQRMPTPGLVGPINAASVTPGNTPSVLPNAPVPIGPIFQMVNVECNGSTKKILMALPSSGPGPVGGGQTTTQSLPKPVLSQSLAKQNVKTTTNPAVTTQKTVPVKNQRTMLEAVGTRSVPATGQQQGIFVPATQASRTTKAPFPASPVVSAARPPQKVVIVTQPMSAGHQTIFLQVPPGLNSTAGGTTVTVPSSATFLPGLPPGSTFVPRHTVKGTSFVSKSISTPQQGLLTGKIPTNGTVLINNQDGTKVVSSLGGKTAQSSPLGHLKPIQGSSMNLTLQSTSSNSQTNTAAGNFLNPRLLQMPGPTRMIFQVAPSPVSNKQTLQQVQTSPRFAAPRLQTSPRTILIPVTGTKGVTLPNSKVPVSMHPGTVVVQAPQVSGIRAGQPSVLPSTAAGTSCVPLQMPTFPRGQVPFKNGNFIFIPSTPAKGVNSNPVVGKPLIRLPSDQKIMEFKKGGQSFFMHVPVSDMTDTKRLVQNIATVKSPIVANTQTIHQPPVFPVPIPQIVGSKEASNDLLSRTPIEIKPALDSEVDSVISALQGGEASLVPIQDSNSPEQEEPIDCGDFDFGLKIDSVYSLSEDTAAIRWDDNLQEGSEADSQFQNGSQSTGLSSQNKSGPDTDPDMPVLTIEPLSFDAESPIEHSETASPSGGNALERMTEEDDYPNVIRGDCLQVKLAQQAALQLQRQMRRDAEDRETVLSEWQQKDGSNLTESSCGNDCEPPVLELQMPASVPSSVSQSCPEKGTDMSSSPSTTNSSGGELGLSTALSEHTKDKNEFHTMVDEIISEYFQSPERPQRKVMLRTFSDCTSDSDDTPRSLVTTEKPPAAVITNTTFPKPAAKNKTQFVMAPINKSMALPIRPVSSTANVSLPSIQSPQFVKIVSKDASGKSTTRVIQAVSAGGQPMLRIVWPTNSQLQPGQQQPNAQQQPKKQPEPPQQTQPQARPQLLPKMLQIIPDPSSKMLPAFSTKSAPVSQRTSLSKDGPASQPLLDAEKDAPIILPKRKKRKRKKKKNTTIKTKKCSVILDPLYLKGRTTINLKRVKLASLFKEPRRTRATKRKQNEDKVAKQSPPRKRQKGKGDETAQDPKPEKANDDGVIPTGSRPSQSTAAVPAVPVPCVTSTPSTATATASSVVVCASTAPPTVNPTTILTVQSPPARSTASSVVVCASTAPPTVNPTTILTVQSPPARSTASSVVVCASTASPTVNPTTILTVQSPLAKSTSSSTSTQAPILAVPVNKNPNTNTNTKRPIPALTKPTVILPMPSPGNVLPLSTGNTFVPGRSLLRSPAVIPMTSTTVPKGVRPMPPLPINVPVSLPVETSTQKTLTTTTAGKGTVQPQSVNQSKHKYLLIKTSTGQFLVPVTNQPGSGNTVAGSTPAINLSGLSGPLSELSGPLSGLVGPLSGLVGPQTSGPITTAQTKLSTVTKTTPARTVTVPFVPLKEKSKPPQEVKIKEEPKDDSYDKYESVKKRKADPGTEVTIKIEPMDTEEQEIEDKQDQSPVDHLGRIEALKARLREHEQQLDDLRKEREETRRRLDSFTECQ